MVKGFSLREKKFAKTKLAITDEFMRQLKTMRFDDISIQAVCEAVEISEGTFYNYFPRKFDVLVYRLTLQDVYRMWRVEREAKGGSKLSQIDLFFKIISSEFTEAHVVYELISVMIDERFQKNEIEISELEKIYAFPDCPGIEQLVAENCSCPEDCLRKMVAEAQAAGEISEATDGEEIVTMLMSILMGSVLAIQEKDFAKVGRYIEKQLAFLWHGLRRGDNETIQ